MAGREPGDALAIVIDPGLAFGTGAHPTTRLCLELCRPGHAPRRRLRLRRLSVAARKLGLAHVHAVDDDPLAIETTRSNAERNGVDVDARVADAASDELPAAGPLVANIALDVVESIAGG